MCQTKLTSTYRHPPKVAAAVRVPPEGNADERGVAACGRALPLSRLRRGGHGRSTISQTQDDVTAAAPPGWSRCVFLVR